MPAQTKTISNSDFLKIYFALSRFINQYKDWDKFSIAATKLKGKYESIANQLQKKENKKNILYAMKDEDDVPILQTDSQGRTAYKYTDVAIENRDNAITDLMNETIEAPLHIVENIDDFKLALSMFNLEERLLFEGILIPENTAENTVTPKLKLA